MIKYIPRKDNPRANALSRQLGYKDNKVYQESALLRYKGEDLVLAIREAVILKAMEPWVDRLAEARGSLINK